MKTLLTIVCMSLIISAKAQLGNYDANGKVKIVTQRTWMKIDKTQVELASEKEVATAIIGAVLGPLIDWGVDFAKEKIKQNAAKYASTLVVNASGSEFWISDKKVNLPKLTIFRNVVPADGAKEQEAMKLILVPELSPDKTAFRYVLDKTIIYNYSSAKTKRAYDYIDIQLDIKFKAITVTKSQYEVKELRATMIKIPMIKVGAPDITGRDAIVSGWIPFPSMPTLEVETAVTKKDVKTTETKGKKEGKDVDDKLETTTTSKDFKSTDKEVLSKNSGLYEFEVTITETNPYKIKAENIQKVVEATGESSASLLKAIGDVVFKKEKSDKAE